MLHIESVNFVDEIRVLRFRRIEIVSVTPIHEDVDEVSESDEYFELEVGAVDYGLGIQGVLGLDLLRRAGAIIDLPSMTLHFPD